MTTIPTSREDLDRLERIGFASTETEETLRWTELAIYYDAESVRPFLAVTIGATVLADEHERFRCQTAGTLGAAIEAFDPSDLRLALVNSLPSDVGSRYPSGDEQRAIKAALNRGYRGELTLRGAARWLYFDFDEISTHQVAQRLERDFGVPTRTATNALNDQGKPMGWVTAFIKALRFVDRKAFHREIGHG